MPTAFALYVAKITILCLWAARPLHANTNMTVPEQVQRLERIIKLKNTLQQSASPYVKITIIEVPHCIQIQCKFICFNGKSDEIAKDINQVASVNGIACPVFEELRLYNYEFINSTISPGFLGTYASKVQAIYIASSNVADVEGGAFSNGVFQKICFEDLQLRTLKKEFFEGISGDFYELSIVQKDLPVQSICSTFLSHVKYQIKALTLQVGITCIRNITAAGNLLNNLAYVDLSYNDFGASLSADIFSKLSMVKHLDLSHSNIAYLPDYIFCELTSTLEFLDLSHNRLVTISRMIFGWRDIPRLLKVEADANPWNCTCELSAQMKEIFVYQSAKLFCATPPKYHQWSVFDERLCDEEVWENATTTITSSNSTTPPLPQTTSSTNFPSTTEIITQTLPPAAPSVATTFVASTAFNTPSPGDTQCTSTVHCVSPTNKSECSWHTIECPPLQFQLTPQPKLRVDITIEMDGLDESYGLLWFSKVARDYRKMEVNYNEYGLGCYGPLAHTTTVENLVPDIAYTFCVVPKDQRTISPFSCESIHVGGNVGVNAWLTRDMRAKGISLVILGVVIFSFAGICMVSLLLKHKPILLKGSKRVATTSSSSVDIVVFPKETILEDFKLKEQMLAKSSSGSTNSPIVRRGSVESIESYQSYMNANLYEVIPAYLKLQDPDLYYEQMPTCSLPETNDKYLPPLACKHNADNLVIYAQVPHRTKRISNDPLPAVPQSEPHTLLPLQLCSCNEEDTSLKDAATEDSRV